MPFSFKYFTSEAVSAGHPDKIADQISDLILDLYLKEDQNSRTAIETLVTHKKIIIAGEIKGPKIENHLIEESIRNLLKNIGYKKELLDWENIEIVNLLHKQSEEISKGVDFLTKKGAGDQGIMFGFATEEAEEFMPAPLYYANLILKNLLEENKYFGPDGKSQITIGYKNNKPVSAENIVISVQHEENITQEDIKNTAFKCIKKYLPWAIKEENIFINPAGTFIRGGPISDCGLTGRKIVADTYGGMVQNGGGAFSGKDGTKVDRSAAYIARYIAKNIVASKIAKYCNVQICYAIGVDHPLSFQINTYGSSIIPEEKILDFIKNNIDLSPYGIINYLKLKNPIYLPTATYGHFGKNHNGQFFTWEKLDLVNELKKLL